MEQPIYAARLYHQQMRIAVIDRDRCQPKKCTLECMHYCPMVRNGQETIVMGDDGKPLISEALCMGCGICVHKCPFGVIQIIGLPEELKGELIHQYGENGFRLYRLPCPKEGKVVGLLGPNGIGKTTAVNILSGRVIPNLGNVGEEATWDAVLDYYSGTEHWEYMRRLAEGKLRCAVKPQYVDKIPALYSGKVSTLLAEVGDEESVQRVCEMFELTKVVKRDVSKLSGGELQRLALASTFLKDADVYFFDEPSSYLDIHQRLRVARIIRDLSKERAVMVVEHDLAVLDFLADTIYLLYGAEGAYGVVAQPRNVRNGINTYLSGFMREENVRFRDKPIVFEPHPPRHQWKTPPLFSFPELEKRFRGFTLHIRAGEIRVGEVVGVVGPNAIGKTTFVKMLAGVEKPSKGALDEHLDVSYKPQYIRPTFDGTFSELLCTMEEQMDLEFFSAEVEKPLQLTKLMEKNVQSLSGGELQRVAIAIAICRNADLYLIDEPSAYLDSNQRMEVAKLIRRVAEKRGCSTLVVDHDVYFLDLVSDALMVFKGVPSVRGESIGPLDMRKGMNHFLKSVDITFRRDEETKRPRINKPGSHLDREQKRLGEYYYE